MPQARKKRKKSGPTGSVAGITAEIEQANRDRANPEDIPRLLAALRSAEKDAEAAIVRAFRWMVYESISQDTEELDYEKLGGLYEGLTVAVGRLKNNDETNVEKFIGDELFRSRKDFIKQESPDLIPPASTVWNQKERGDTPYKRLRRIESAVRDQSDDDGDAVQYDAIEDSALATPSGDQNGKEVQTPDSPRKRELATSTTFSDLRLDLAKTELEIEVFELLALGYAPARIATHLAITRYRVERIMILFGERALRAGYDFKSLLHEEAA